MKKQRETRKNRHEDLKKSGGKKNSQLNRAKQQSWYLDHQFEKALQKEM